MVLGDSGLPSSQLKPLAHFSEEFGDRCLNRQPFAAVFFCTLILLLSPLLLISDVSTIQRFNYKKKMCENDVTIFKTKCSFPASFT